MLDIKMHPFVSEKMFKDYSEFWGWTHEFPTVIPRTECPFCSSVKDYRETIARKCNCDEAVEGHEEDRMMVLHIKHANMTGEELDGLGNRLGKVYTLSPWEEPEEIKQDLGDFVEENPYATLGVYDHRDLCGLLQGISEMRKVHALNWMFDQGPRNREPLELSVNTDYMWKDFIPSKFDLGNHVFDCELRVEDQETVADDHYDYIEQPVFSLDMPLCRWTRRPYALTSKEVENLLEVAMNGWYGYPDENICIS